MLALIVTCSWNVHAFIMQWCNQGCLKVLVEHNVNQMSSMVNKCLLALLYLSFLICLLCPTPQIKWSIHSNRTVKHYNKTTSRIGLLYQIIQPGYTIFMYIMAYLITSHSSQVILKYYLKSKLYPYIATYTYKHLGQLMIVWGR